MPEKEVLIAQAAEALIIKKGNIVIKRRIKKGYRISELDEKLRKLRTRSEAKLLEKAGKLVSVPKLISVDEKTKEIEMEFLNGKKLSENLDTLPNRFEIMEKVGEVTAKIHDADIIHGDLTTSNMILAEKNENKINNPAASIEQPQKNGKELITHNVKLSRSERARGVHEETIIKTSERASSEESEVYLIDFGLGFISKRIEDKAVDLHLIKQALEAKHFKEHEKLFSSFEKGYASKDKVQILEQLKKVEARGRYKH